ncbi:MAG: copper resistance protein CopC/CopD [Thermomicrobiales bacterium]|nr:copper resistance protein CopC/CopD [Thermomicrobiales bacterium]
MTASLIRRCGAAVGLVLLILGLGSAPAEGHAFLERSDPAANAILPTSPATVSLWFTERLEPASTSARLIDQRGVEMGGVSFAIGSEKQLIVTLPPDLPNGTYSIVWRNVSRDDGHPANGYVPFTVGTIADVAPVVLTGAGEGGAPQWLRAGSRWLAFIGLFAVVAVWPVWGLVLSPALRSTPASAERGTGIVERFALVAIGMSLVGNLAALIAQALDVGGEFGEALDATLFDSRYGDLMMLRIGLLLAHGLVLSFIDWRDPWERAELAGVALASSVAMVLPFSLNAHASAQPAGRAFAIAADAVHLTAAAIWAGGALLLLTLVVGIWRSRPEDARPLASAAIPRFSALAIAAWICLAATGVYAAWLEIGGWNAARETDYGRAFLVKMALAIITLLFGAFHLLIVTRRLNSSSGERWSGRFRGSLAIEVAVIALLLLATGWMTSQPPAREVLAAESPAAAQIVLTLEANGTTGTLLIAPGTAGPNTVSLQLPAGIAPADAEALLRLTGPDPGMGEPEITLNPTGDGIWSIDGSQFSVEGAWSVTAIVRKIGEFQWQATANTVIAAAPETGQASIWRLGDWWIVGLVVLVVVAIATGYGLLRRRFEPAAGTVM